jgi:hypothetical protein
MNINHEAEHDLSGFVQAIEAVVDAKISLQEAREKYPDSSLSSYVAGVNSALSILGSYLAIVVDNRVQYILSGITKASTDEKQSS